VKRSIKIASVFVVSFGIISIAVISIFLIELNYSSTPITFDEEGIPINDYGTILDTNIGKQRNPVTISQRGLAYYNVYQETGNQTSKQFFINTADWLIENAHNKGDYSIFEYDFPYPQYDMPASSWHDGMAQGRAIEVLIRAHNVTNDQKYLDESKLLLNAFFVDVQDDGVTYKSDDGWWYEHYAHRDGKAPRILNAHIFSMLGIYDYYQYTNDTDAKFLFDQGVISLKNNLPIYDLNGYSYYNVLGDPAPPKYHKIHIKLTNDLYEITNEEIFKEYHDKWKNCNDICKLTPSFEYFLERKLDKWIYNHFEESD